MAIQILPREQGLGELLGTGLGSGLSSGLQQLAQSKMDELKKRNEGITNLGALVSAGMPIKDAAAISIGGGDPNLLMKAFQMKQKGDIAERKISAKRQEQESRLINKRIETLQTKADSGKQIIPSLESFKQIIDKGDASSPAMNTISLWFGKQLFGKEASVDWILTESAQKQRKYTADLLAKEVKEQKRPTKELLRRLEQGNPNIFTDPEVQKVVINSKLFNRYYEQEETKVSQDVAIENPNLSLAAFNKEVSSRMKPIEDDLKKQYIPQEKSMQPGQVVDSLPSPFESPVGAEYEDGKYIKRNTGTSWKIVRKNPTWKG